MREKTEEKSLIPRSLLAAFFGGLLNTRKISHAQVLNSGLAPIINNIPLFPLSWLYFY